MRPTPKQEEAPSLDALADRLSPAELEELATLLDDDALARMAVAAVRQMKRRLSRGRRGEQPGPALQRAFRQLAAELGGGNGSE